MRTIILFYLKGRHEKHLDNFHMSKYRENKDSQSKRWEKVVHCRNLIRRLEPDFLIGKD